VKQIKGLKTTINKIPLNQKLESLISIRHALCRLGFDITMEAKIETLNSSIAIDLDRMIMEIRNEIESNESEAIN